MYHGTAALDTQGPNLHYSVILFKDAKYSSTRREEPVSIKHPAWFLLAGSGPVLHLTGSDQEDGSESVLGQTQSQDGGRNIDTRVSICFHGNQIKAAGVNEKADQSVQSHPTGFSTLLKGTTAMKEG